MTPPDRPPTALRVQALTAWIDQARRTLGGGPVTARQALGDRVGEKGSSAWSALGKRTAPMASTKMLRAELERVEGLLVELELLRRSPVKDQAARVRLTQEVAEARTELTAYRTALQEILAQRPRQTWRERRAARAAEHLARKYGPSCQEADRPEPQPEPGPDHPSDPPPVVDRVEQKESREERVDPVPPASRPTPAQAAQEGPPDPEPPDAALPRTPKKTGRSIPARRRRPSKSSKTSAAPGQPQPVSMLTYHLWLRPDLEVKLDLPADLRPQEAAKLAEIVRHLHFTQA